MEAPVLQNMINFQVNKGFLNHPKHHMIRPYCTSLANICSAVRMKQSQNPDLSSEAKSVITDC